MTVRLVPRVKASVISPNTELPFVYVCEESIPNKCPVAKSETTGRIVQAQANDLDRMPCFGIAIESGDTGDTIKVISIGVATDVQRDTDFSYDDAIYVSKTKGKVTKTPPETVGSYVQRVGRALTSSDIIIMVDQTIVEITT